MQRFHYRICRRIHLGDHWARINFALRLVQSGESFALSIRDETSMEILSLLAFAPLKVCILQELLPADARSRLLWQRIDSAAAYQCAYFPTHMRHVSNNGTLGFALEANWRAREKIPPGITDLKNRVKDALPQYSHVLLGRPHQRGLTELVNALAHVDCLIAVDNGVAHVARSVGTPLILLEHNLPIERGFPPDACSYMRVKITDLPTVLRTCLRKLIGSSGEFHHRDGRPAIEKASD